MSKKTARLTASKERQPNDTGKTFHKTVVVSGRLVNLVVG